jgi:outer membrane PBP1 activator LpoA protein
VGDKGDADQALALLTELRATLNDTRVEQALLQSEILQNRKQVAATCEQLSGLASRLDALQAGLDDMRGTRTRVVVGSIVAAFMRVLPWLA